MAASKPIRYKYSKINYLFHLDILEALIINLGLFPSRLKTLSPIVRLFNIYIQSLVIPSNGFGPPKRIFSCFTLNYLYKRYTLIYFVECQLSPSLISLSPLFTTHPRFFQQTPVRSSPSFYKASIWS